MLVASVQSDLIVLDVTDTKNDCSKWEIKVSKEL